MRGGCTTEMLGGELMSRTGKEGRREIGDMKPFEGGEGGHTMWGFDWSVPMHLIG